MATAKSVSVATAEKWALPAQQARSRATRERLLSAAERVFADKGYDGAKLSDIAEVAGCSVGAVYFRFKDKDALFLAIAETFAAESRAGFAGFARSAAALAPDDIVRGFVLRIAANMRTHRGLFRAIIERGLDHPDVIKLVFKFRDQVAIGLEALLRERMAKGDEIGRAVRVMTQIVYGFLLVGILNPHAPTRLDDEESILALANAASAYFKTVPKS